MTENTAQSLTLDDVRAIVSEGIDQLLAGLPAVYELGVDRVTTANRDRIRRRNEQANRLPRTYEANNASAATVVEDGSDSFFNPVRLGSISQGVNDTVVNDLSALGSHNSSPSVDDAGAHSVGDGSGAGDASATPATWVTEGKLAKRLHDSVVRKSEALGRVEKAERKLCDAREDLAHAENEQREASAAYDAFIAGGAA